MSSKQSSDVCYLARGGAIWWMLMGWRPAVIDWSSGVLASCSHRSNCPLACAVDGRICAAAPIWRPLSMWTWTSRCNGPCICHYVAQEARCSVRFFLGINGKGFVRWMPSCDLANSVKAVKRTKLSSKYCNNNRIAHHKSFKICAIVHVYVQLCTCTCNCARVRAIVHVYVHRHWVQSNQPTEKLQSSKKCWGWKE